MRAFVYLYKTTLKNSIIKALKRPVTYIYLVIFGFYLWSMVFGLGTIIDTLHLNQPEGFAAALSMLMLFFAPANMIAYSKRKGLIFRTSEVQFVFTAPLSPKKILLYAQAKGIIASIILGIVMVIVGIVYSHISIGAMLTYYLFLIVIQNILEASIMVILYGNESIPENIMNKLPLFMYGIVIILVLAGFYVGTNSGFSLETFYEYLSIPWIQGIPIIGWNIAIIRLIILGPTVLNVVCAILHCITTVLLTVYAYQMKCTGEYYEDAMKFADDYQEARKRGKRGEVVRIGKKKKYVKASIEYKGNFAKAIFYRQLLEYKKNKFFIFGGKTLLSLAIGIGIAVFAHFNPNIMQMKEFVIPGVAAYITFIFSGYATKWSKELENPYTFLIPDSPFRKVWYATLIEHMRALIDGCLITIPGAIYMKINPINTILIILIYVCLQANKLYSGMLAQCIAGQTLGDFAKGFIKILVQTPVIMASIIAAIITSIKFGTGIGFSVLIFVAVCFTIIISMGAVVLFDKMETVE